MVVAICHRNLSTSPHGLFSLFGARMRSEKELRTRFIFKRVKSGGREGEGGSRFDHDGLLLRAY